MFASNYRAKKSPKWLSLAVLCATSVLAVLGCGQSPTTSSSSKSAEAQILTSRGELQFVNNIEAGCKLAAEKNMPCLLFFTADWCTYCHEMEDTAFIDPQVAKMSENFVCVLVDADREKEVCGQFSISGYPTIQFVSSKGRVLNRLVGRQSATELIAGMRAALKRFAWLDDPTTKLR